MEEKRNLVYEISDQPHASELLQSWSRQEILEILCAEMGKERKYTGLTKLKIVENLLKIVSEKKSGSTENVADLDHQSSSPYLSPNITKRQRKIDQPSRLPVPENNIPISSIRSDSNIAVYCRNSACKATLNEEDKFCKRCSCCICYQYDDNKDPSLWLSCSSDPPFQGTSCGLSCHLECALKHEKSGISKGQQVGVEGTFYCLSCGKVNDLLGSWRKQLMKAKETRRVDILCYRISLAKKILSEGEKYQDVCRIVDEAVKKLEAEVGPLTGVPVGTGRGIVNRLSSGPEVQKLCTLAIDTLDSLLSKKILHQSPISIIQDTNLVATNLLRFEDVDATYLTVVMGTEDVSSGKTVGYRLWHRKACDIDYPIEPTCILSQPNLRFVVRGLTPSSEYYFKAISFNGTGDMGMCEVQISTASAREDHPGCLVIERSQSSVTNVSELSNPSSVEDETNNVMPCSDQTDSQTENYLSYCKDPNKIITANLSKDAINCTDVGGGETANDSVYLLDEKHVTKKSGMLPDPNVLKHEDKHSSEIHIIEDTSVNNGSNSAVVQEGTKCPPFVNSSGAGLPATPCKMEILTDVLGRSGRSKSSATDREIGSEGDKLRRGSKSKKRSAEIRDADCTANGISDKDFEYYVKLIRWLECEGHIDKNFRQKFLTWYSLSATSQEVRIVKAFVDNFIEDPSALAEQLVDTFSECISSKKTCAVPAGFCMKLWH
ncbi:VIN3-like protein 2 isoform X2 [Cucurbita maxima]|nr:VIN3-like protein 2 isoform X2 [Cucurbita maxima]XP_023006886.1 VIN3-like protein 2 isoform X2 [Cucurbita maxima]XP_023006895.1 VIN3-like protein 2 isoform X2 [Cucurbita maxima]XP_023006903.1 VIN3-like protein 2 isoform X2 [Cucurbita maxima]XP_023006912.1 VIN3-like protein 2 isoform X2 [Cucurbita maxima]